MYTNTYTNMLPKIKTFSITRGSTGENIVDEKYGDVSHWDNRITTYYTIKFLTEGELISTKGWKCEKAYLVKKELKYKNANTPNNISTEIVYNKVYGDCLVYLKFQPLIKKDEVALFIKDYNNFVYKFRVKTEKGNEDILKYTFDYDVDGEETRNNREVGLLIAY